MALNVSYRPSSGTPNFQVTDCIRCIAVANIVKIECLL